jgi:hypothetical protein
MEELSISTHPKKSFLFHRGGGRNEKYIGAYLL